MSNPGTADNPLRVAVVGCGPSGFYVADAVLKTPGLVAQVDMFDRLPTPYGLVRYGVAPDHQEVKRVTKVYAKTAEHPSVRWFGGVEFGKHLTMDDVRAHYHAVAFTTGAQTDRRLDIPGEDLQGSHPATQFVAWYNGHPDCRHLSFDLSTERAVVIGVGNVAIDVARMLCRTPDELAKTDIADYALEALRKSRVREVLLVGRRGPAQAAFSPKEIEEIAELPDVDVLVTPAEAALDPLSAAWLEKEGARSQQRNVKFLQEHASAAGTGKPKQLRCRFLVGPTELRGSSGKLQTIRVQHMTLVADPDGTPRPQARDSFEDLPVDLVFKAIGYRGVPVPGVPFDQKKGIVPNVDGRVHDKVGGVPVPGYYASGWCKRGPTGLIGTNSLDAKATVEAMKVDRDKGLLLAGNRGDIVGLLQQRGVDVATWADWQRLDAWEQAEGKRLGKLRQKLTSIDAMMQRVRALRPAAK